MSLEPDIEQRIQRRRRYLWIAATLAYSALLVSSGSLEGAALIATFTSPIVGSIVSYWLVKHWTGQFFRFFKGRAYAGTAGNFHTFDDLQVRIEWQDEQCRICAQDVLALLAIKPSQEILRRLAAAYPAPAFYRDAKGIWWFSEVALLDWLRRKSASLDQRAQRVLRWFEKEALPPLRKKMTGFHEA